VKKSGTVLGPARASAFAALLLLAACARKSEPLPIYSQIPAFALTAEDGAEFRSAERLGGKIWVADFIFTTCTGPCPRMSRQMKQVHDKLAESGAGDVRLVSFTVDPKNDTPPALAAYARRYGADPARWSFLTGSVDTLHSLKREAFKLGSVDGSNDHSTRFVLVDRQGRARKFYGTLDASPVTELLADIAALRKEPS
jgi:protein SCO1/2